MTRRYSLHVGAEDLVGLRALAAANGLTVSENIRRGIKARLIANAHLVRQQRCPTCKRPKEAK